MTSCRKGANLAIAAVASSLLKLLSASAATIWRVSVLITFARSAVAACSISAAISPSCCSIVARSSCSSCSESGFLSTWYWRAIRSSEPSFSVSRRLFSAAATPVTTNCSLCAANRSRLTSAQTTATSKGSATRPKPTRIRPLSDRGRRNFMVSV